MTDAPIRANKILPVARSDGNVRAQAGVLVDGETFFPIQCHGLDLFGIAYKDRIYVTVHDLSTKLWTNFDTPRASVQRKIKDLDIEIINCTRPQLEILRSAGVIENFRATMVLATDAKKIFGALQESLSRRGLHRHAVRTNPIDRPQRREEVRANRLDVNMNSRSQRLAGGKLQQRMRPLPELVTRSTRKSSSALNRNGSELVGSQVKESSESSKSSESGSDATTPTSENRASISSKGIDFSTSLRIENFELQPEKLLNQAFFSPAFVRPPDSVIPPTSMDTDNPQSTKEHYPRSVDPRHETLCSLNTDNQLQSQSALESPGSIVTTSTFASLSLSQHLTSPELSSCEQEDGASLASKTSSASAKSSSPQGRFLFLDSESDADSSKLTNSSQTISQLLETPLTHPPTPFAFSANKPATLEFKPHTVGETKSGDMGVFTAFVSSPSLQHSHMKRNKHRKIPATKLRHFAHATSPSSFQNAQLRTRGQPGPSSLIVSIPLSPVSGTNVETTSLPPASGTNVETASLSPVSGTNVETASLPPVSGTNVETASLSPVSGVNVETASLPPASSTNIETASNSATSVNKPRKLPALLNYAMKKRAEIPSLSPPSLAVNPSLSEILVNSDKDALSLSPKTHKPKGRAILASTTGSARPTAKAIASSNSGFLSIGAPVPSSLSGLSKTCPVQSPTSLTPTSPASMDTSLTQKVDTAVTSGSFRSSSSSMSNTRSASSSSTTSSASGSSTTSSMSGVGRRKKAQYAKPVSSINPFQVESGFSFEALFSYYPPDLTVRNGELVPVHSLSVRHLDKSSIPSGHPLETWRLGQPVRGRKPQGTGKKRGKKSAKSD